MMKEGRGEGFSRERGECFVTTIYITLIFYKSIEAGFSRNNTNIAGTCSASDGNFHKHANIHFLLVENSDEAVNKHQHSLLYFQ